MTQSLLSYRRMVAAAGAGLALAALGPAVAQAGPVQVISQEREIRAGARVGVTGEDGVTDEDSQDDREVAPDAGPFNATVSADVSREGFVARSSATMNSTLDDDGFDFAGRLEWEVENQGLDPDEAVAEALFDVTVIFSLDEAYRYNFATDLNVIRNEGGDPEGQDVNFRLVSQTDGQEVPEGSGTLAPGEYRLDLLRYVANSGADAPVEGAFAEEYDIRLELEQADGGDGGGGGETPIPLPPAVWAGLSVMGLGLLNRWRKSRLA